MASQRFNSKRNEVFGRLLSGAINSIATYEGKTAPLIEEELGGLAIVSGKTIQRYKAGHLPPEMHTIEILAEAAIHRGYLGREWLERFLYAARYPLASQLLDRLCPPPPTRPRPPRVYHNLPAPTYSQFVMRQQAFAEVADGLQQRSAVILIVGLGGNGKTSLAREVAACCLQDDETTPRFDAVVWVSDKDRPGTMNLSIVLDEIARTLDYPGFAQFEHEEKRREIEQLLRRQKVLLVVDNFETINDGALLTWLLSLPEPSKALITTREYRREFRRGGWPVDLRGMTEDEANKLIAERVRVLKIEKLVALRQLEPLLAATGGNPKAIEMTMGLLKYERRPLQDVVEDLYAARGELFDDLFTRAWMLLDEAARCVLLVATFFPASTSAETLSATADVHGFIFDHAIERLTDLALIDVQQADLGDLPRYALHPLARAFAAARLKEQLGFEAKARERAGRYFVDFAMNYIVRNIPNERYWNSIIGRDLIPVDPELKNLLSILAWADRNEKHQLLIDLMMVWTHYLGRRALLKRIYYAQKAAQAAHVLGQGREEALLRIDALGWILIETGRFIDADREIRTGVNIAEDLDPESADSGLAALGYSYLARIFLEQENLIEAELLLNQAKFVQCVPVIQHRVHLARGDLARNRGNNSEAIKIYEELKGYSQKYGSERELCYRAGNIYLEQGDLKKAEIEFEEITATAQSKLDIAYAQYGLAQIAELRADVEKARLLAEEAEDALFRLGVRHGLRKRIKEYLSHLTVPIASESHSIHL